MDTVKANGLAARAGNGAKIAVGCNPHVAGDGSLAAILEIEVLSIVEPEPNGRRKKDSVGILTDRDSATALYADGLRVSLLQIEAVESVDFGPYREWELPGLIVTALKTKLEQAYPETEIRAVIIRDFQRVGA